MGETPRGRTFHVGVSVRGMLLRRDRELRGLLRDDTGRSLDPREARLALMDELAKGHEVLPLAECPAWDFRDGCPGHPHEVPDALFAASERRPSPGGGEG